MPRESVDEKARRYLQEARLTVKRVDGGGLIVAECRGNGAVYDLGYDPWRKEWRCTCPSRGRCAHILSLQSVTVQP